MSSKTEHRHHHQHQHDHHHHSNHGHEELIDSNSITLSSKIFGWYWPTSEKKVLEAEELILSYVKTPVKRRLVDIGGSKINTVEVGSHFEEPEKQHLNKTIVITPGYACGVGHFYRNLNALGTHPGLKTYAIDWLGTGRSSRVPFPWKPGQEGSVESAEDFFVESLENWRKAQGIEKMVLAGHSFGGYLSSVYAMRYPERVEHLVMISPVGVPKKPELTPEEEREQAKRLNFLFKTVRFFWELNVTPQDVVRLSGHFGPRLVKSYTTRRFEHLDSDEIEILNNYNYHISARKGSGEYALNVILSVGAWARKPLLDRLHAVKVPTTFIYGAHDWMDPNAGREAMRTMSVETKFHQLHNAGHQLHIDNPSGFNKIMLDLVKKLQSNN